MARNIPFNLQQNVIREAHDAIIMGVPNMLADVIRLAGKELPNVVQTMGEALKIKALPKTEMTRANVKVAEAAQAAVVRGWYSRLPRKTWRGSPNRLTGRLGPALADPNNTAYTTDRVISFVNSELLDREAAHWYRVNYGASGSSYAAGRQAARFVMQLNGEAIASFRDDLRPDPISWIPARRYYDSDGNMYPLRSESGKVEIVRSPYGARAARFFDLGYSVVARQAPAAYDKVWRDYVQKNADNARSRLAKKKIQIKGDFRLQRTGWSARVRH